MGWIITTIVLALIWIATTWFAGHIIMNMVANQQRFEDELEERIDISLRILDSCYMDIVLVANKPVFFDSPEVRSVVSAIQRSREAVLNVADVFKDVSVEDNSEDVKLQETKAVTSEDPHQPKNLEDLDKETRNEVIKNAVRSGKMEVLEPMGMPRGNPGTIPGPGDGQASTDSMRAAVALSQQITRIQGMQGGVKSDG